MKSLAPALLFIAVMTCSCQHTRNLQGGCIVNMPPKTIITLESVTETADSPGRGSTFFPFPLPQYPYQMLRAGISGEAVVRVVVGKDGIVTHSAAIESTLPDFAAPAAFAAERWRFFEFLDPGVRERRGMVLDCRIRFALSYDEQ